jgi:hypothetical protein
MFVHCPKCRRVTCALPDEVIFLDDDPKSR